MTRDTPEFTVDDADELEDALAQVVETAVENGVDVRGAWEFRTRGSTHDWEVEIVELARFADGE